MDYLSFGLYLLLAYAAVRLLFWSAKRSNQSRQFLPPGPPTIPIFGNLLILGKHPHCPHVTLADLAKTYGSLMTLQFGQVTAVIVSSSKVAREVLQKNDISFCNRTLIDSVRATNHHQKSLIWLPVTPQWRDLRKMCNTHVFSSAKLETNQSLRRNKVVDLISFFEKCGESGIAVDVREAAFSTMLNLLSTIFFSVDLVDIDPNSNHGRDFKETIRGIVDEAGKPNLADFFPLLRRMDPQGIRRRTCVRFQKVVDLFNTMIKERLQGERPPGLESDFLDALLGINQQKTAQIETSNIPNLLLDLFTAGTDSVSSTLEWAMSELLHRPEKLKKLKAELNEIIGEGNPFEESYIEQLPYLQAVLKETFRLHPAAPFMVPRKPDTDVTVSGFTVPQNAQILVNVWAIGRDPDIWESPNLFEPERFLGSDINVKGCDFELIPFGAGRRICVGLPLAIRMLHLMVGSVVHGFDWKLEGGVLNEEMDMEEKLVFALQMDQPLRVIPVRINSSA